jgi:hypothetical protein
MKYILCLFFLIAGNIQAQELFVFTEPASNMSSHSIGARVESHFMQDLHKQSKHSYMLMPELMWGASKKLMFHAAFFFSDMDGSFYANGSSLYLKYRFLSNDGVHKHFRMAAFGKAAINNTHIHQYAIDLNGRNSGYEAGIIATQLINRLAVGSSFSVVHATDNSSGEKFLFGNKLRNAVNYSLSAGMLVLPKEYTSYNQVNMNVMVEMLGQSNTHNGFNYLDMAPSLQFIFNSRLKVDMGYYFALVKKLQRSTLKGAVLRLEYTIFNVY